MLKTKTGSQRAKGFASVLSASSVPEKVQTGAGKEFFNKTFKALMKKHAIIHFVTGSDLKSPMKTPSRYFKSCISTFPLCRTTGLK